MTHSPGLHLKCIPIELKKYIGAYTVALSHVDAIVFTGGIGEHASKVRKMVCEGLYESIGVDIDTEKNNISSSECPRTPK